MLAFLFRLRMLAAGQFMFESAESSFQKIPPKCCLQADRKSTRLNCSHTDIYPLSLPDALPIYVGFSLSIANAGRRPIHVRKCGIILPKDPAEVLPPGRSEEHTSELQSH